MYFESLGRKNNKSVLLIHGAMWARSLHRQRLPLSKHFHTVFVHMNGHGKEFESRFERDKIVDELVEYIKEHNLSKPHIIGFSLGTQIALLLADRHSELIGNTALISPLIDATENEIASLRFTMKALATAAKIKPLAKIAASVLKIEEDTKTEFMQEMKKQKVNELVEDIIQDMLNLDELKNIGNVKNKFYIATGLKDSNHFIRSARVLKKTLQNSVLSVFENCGHNIPIICSKRLNAELKIFLNS